MRIVQRFRDHAEAISSDQVRTFGGCPACGANDGFYNAGKGHWAVCHFHRVRWFVGSNLFSGWRDETEEHQRHKYEVHPGWGSYDDVKPWHPTDGEIEAIRRFYLGSRKRNRVTTTPNEKDPYP